MDGLANLESIVPLRYVTFSQFLRRPVACLPTLSFGPTVEKA
ncbi:MAG: hypothetical protein KatS3mg107_0358 [Gemmataceae bacterium]|nr:MAG: hypothetical protein KatS3mg107_0358 [Gemmataceae bacterium]